MAFGSAPAHFFCGSRAPFLRSVVAGSAAAPLKRIACSAAFSARLRCASLPDLLHLGDAELGCRLGFVAHLAAPRASPSTGKTVGATSKGAGVERPSDIALSLRDLSTGR
jgi:hypothetical protein